jgi:hypothetical protein
MVNNSTNNHASLHKQPRLTSQTTTPHFTNNHKNPIFRHIKSNNSGMAKVKIVKKKRDPPLSTSKQLIKF